MATGKKKFYAVRVGHKTGIYSTWEECKLQVDGYPKAEYKSFPTLKNAEDYLEGIVESQPRQANRPKIAAEVTVPQFPGSRLESAGGTGKSSVVIYADGACSGNPGPGGYGTVILQRSQCKELSAGFRLTTNNRMEILGCIAGLLQLEEPSDVTIYSDSSYVVNTMSKSWALRWRSNGWKRREKTGELKDVLNQDLWVRMLDLCDKHRVRFEWVRGHDGNEGNERCDELARAAAAGAESGIDSAYEVFITSRR